ncbi:unnamed protein product [Mesocestoides corti]|uniref:ATP-dependent RNA helicase Ski2/MTR4 C-terminal domain-containing protein n=1 Tax=Mesocestoides corti TaxID=53468 RepID=A0A0R3U511_MESCO|nr:unnamed protein product [Mesocestoides corti]
MQNSASGLAACEIDQREVLLCEALCRGLLNHQTPAEAATLLSCFVCDNQCEGRRPFVAARLQAVVERMLQLAIVAEKSGADEGHLLRAFKRLGEFLQQARKARHHLGYEALETLMRDAHVAINRVALNTSSLYISDDM